MPQRMAESAYTERFHSRMSPDTKRQFDILMITLNRKGTELLEEAVGLLVKKHGRHSIKPEGRKVRK